MVKQYLRIWQNKASVLLDDARLWMQRLVNRVRAQPRLFIMIGAGLGGVILIVGVLWSGVLSGLFAAPTIADLQREVKENPGDAESRLLLGHALFSQGQRDRALRAYSKALELDGDIADSKLVDNLIDAFGTKARNRAANLIAKHKLTGAEDQLRDFLGHKYRSVRAKALKTLEKIGKASRSDRISFFMQDLRQKNCKIRLRAVAKLGAYADEQVIPALKAADKKDKDETPWYRSSCLGDAVDAAVKKIRKRK